MENNRKLSVSCIVIKEDKVLVVDTTKELVKSILDARKSVLKISDFVNSRFDISTWQLYM